MEPNELKAIEDEIVMLRRRSDELAERLVKLREKGDSIPPEPTEDPVEPSPPGDSKA